MKTTTADSKMITGRREFLKKGAYVAPLIITLNAVPAFAGTGSGYGGGGGKGHDKGRGNGHDKGRGNGHHKGH